MKKDRIPIEIVCLIIFMVAFVSFCNNKAILLLAQIILLLSFLSLVKINDFRMVFSNYIYWYGSFALWATLSLTWAREINYAMSSLISVWQVVLFGTIIVIILNTKEKIELLFKGCVIANCVLVLRIMIVTSLDEWHSIIFGTYNAASADGRLGYSVGLFPNSLGEIMVVFSVVLLYHFFKTTKLVYIFGIGINLLIILLTKSRTALLFLFFCIVIMLFLKSSFVAKLQVVMITILVLVIGVYMILNIPILYDLVGFRIAGLLAIFDNSTYIVDDSTLGRLKLFKAAYNVFCSSPIVGVGLNNCGYISYYTYNIWGIVPAHNNYIELLADVGVIGTVLYYGLLVISLYRGVSLLKNKDDNQYRVVLPVTTILLYRLIADFFGVSYVEDFLQMILAVCIACVNVYYGGRQNREWKSKETV